MINPDGFAWVAVAGGLLMFVAGVARLRHDGLRTPTSGAFMTLLGSSFLLRDRLDSWEQFSVTVVGTGILSAMLAMVRSQMSAKER